MASTWGQHLKISLFGESHGNAIGCVLDHLPPGEPVDPEVIAYHNRRRQPGRAAWATTRQEADEVEILSGVFSGKTTGTPLALLIRNRGQRSADYEQLQRTPRPGHGDMTGYVRYAGSNDPRGGGHFSGRITAPLVAAGSIAEDSGAPRY